LGERKTKCQFDVKEHLIFLIFEIIFAKSINKLNKIYWNYIILTFLIFKYLINNIILKKCIIFFLKHSFLFIYTSVYVSHL